MPDVTSGPSLWINRIWVPMATSASRIRELEQRATNDSHNGLTKASWAQDASTLLRRRVSGIRRSSTVNGGPRRTLARRELHGKGVARLHHGNGTEPYGGLSTKIHVSGDIMGKPLQIHPDRGATARHHPGGGVDRRLCWRARTVPTKGPQPPPVSQHHILELGMIPVIPPLPNRKAPADYDRHLYAGAPSGGMPHATRSSTTRWIVIPV